MVFAFGRSSSKSWMLRMSAPRKAYMDLIESPTTVTLQGPDPARAPVVHADGLLARIDAGEFTHRHAIGVLILVHENNGICAGNNRRFQGTF